MAQETGVNEIPNGFAPAYYVRCRSANERNRNDLTKLAHLLMNYSGKFSMEVLS